MKLVWSVFALADRDGIFTHIEADNPSAAIVIDERIAAAVRRLGTSRKVAVPPASPARVNLSSTEHPISRPTR